MNLKIIYKILEDTQNIKSEKHFKVRAIKIIKFSYNLIRMLEL